MSMSMEELEKEVKNLKAQLEEVAQAKDITDIWKLQSLYSHYYHIGDMASVRLLFAQKTPGVRMEIEDSGVYEGYDSVKRFWTEVFSGKRNKSAGWLALHVTVNPVIEINKARNRAKGLWHSHGWVSMVEGGQSKQFLCMGKYDVEYVKEDGQWKFLDFAYRLTYMCPYEKGWVDEPVGASIAGSPFNAPDKPTTYHMPYSKYRINVFQPPPPKPYKE